MIAWVAGVLAAVLLAAGQAPAPQDAAAAAFRAKVDAAGAMIDSDAAGAAEALDHLAVDSLELRKLRPLTAEERPAHARLFVLRARVHVQLLHNDKVQDSLRELLRVDPMFSGGLAPREQELFDEIRRAEGGVIEVTSVERGARVLVSGIEAGTTGDVPVRLPVVAGSYEVRLEKPGFKAAQRPVVVFAGQITSVSDLVPQRNVPPLAFLSDRDDVEVMVDNAALGRTTRLATLRPDLSAEESAALDRFVAAAGLDPLSASAVILRRPAIDRQMTVRFHRPCFVDESRPVSLTSEALTRLDPAEPLFWLGETAIVRMRPDVGTLRVTSTPADADVFLDGQLAGRTPFDRQVCAGPRRVRVRHRIGSYDVSVTITQNRTEVVDIALKPDLAFLGAVEASAGGLVQAAALGSVVDRALASTVTSFHLATRVDLPPELPPWAERQNVDLVAAADRSDGEAVVRLLKQAGYTYDAPLMLVAAGRAAGGAAGGPPLELLVFWRDHPLVDRVPVTAATQAGLAAALAAVNDPPSAATFVYRPDPGLRVADTTLPDAALVVAAVQPGSPAAGAGLKPGDAVAAVDGSPATAAQFAQRLAAKQPGDLITLRLGGAAPRDVPIPVQRRPTHAPAFDTAVPGNALIARLTAAAQAAGGAERDLLTFSEALVHLRFGEWRKALDMLVPLTNLPTGEGVGKGAVTYFRARCHEELGEQDKAVALYKEALTAADQPLSDDGASVASLARYRLALLAPSAGR